MKIIKIIIFCSFVFSIDVYAQDEICKHFAGIWRGAFTYDDEEKCKQYGCNQHVFVAINLTNEDYTEATGLYITDFEKGVQLLACDPSTGYLASISKPDIKGRIKCTNNDCWIDFNGSQPRLFGRMHRIA